MMTSSCLVREVAVHCSHWKQILTIALLWSITFNGYLGDYELPLPLVIQGKVAYPTQSRTGVLEGRLNQEPGGLHPWYHGEQASVRRVTPKPEPLLDP